MDSQKLLKVSVFAGHIMLSNGAETYRIEDTVTRLLESESFSNVEVFATITAIVAGVDDEAGKTTTIVKRVKNRGYNLSKIAKVNNISRAYVNKEITLDEMEKKLNEIQSERGYSALTTTIASAVACFCFTYMMGGNLLASANALFIGIALNLIISASSKKNLSPYLMNLAVGCIISAVTLLFVRLGFNQIQYIDKVIIGSIIPHLPGIAMTNAVRDILEGDYLSGICRILDAVLVALCLSGGVGLVLGGYMFYSGGLIL